MYALSIIFYLYHVIYGSAAFAVYRCSIFVYNNRYFVEDLEVVAYDRKKADVNNYPAGYKCSPDMLFWYTRCEAAK